MTHRIYIADAEEHTIPVAFSNRKLDMNISLEPLIYIYRGPLCSIGDPYAPYRQLSRVTARDSDSEAINYRINLIT